MFLFFKKTALWFLNAVSRSRYNFCVKQAIGGFLCTIFAIILRLTLPINMSLMCWTLFMQHEFKGRYTRGSLLPPHAPAHAPGAKLPRLHQRFLVKKCVAQQNFCSRVLLPHIKLVWYEGASSTGKTVARFCFRSKLPRVYWNFLCGSVFQEQAPSCVLVGVLTREHVSGACFRSKLLSVYWLEYLPGSVFRERVSGASSLVCTGLKNSKFYKEYVSSLVLLPPRNFPVFERQDLQKCCPQRAKNSLMY